MKLYKNILNLVNHRVLIGLLFCLLFFQSTFAQEISINEYGAAPDGSAMLDVVATDKGILIPRMTQAQRSGIANPATSLIVYQTDGDAGFYFNAGTPGTPSWVKLLSNDDLGEPVAIQDGDGDTKVDVEGAGDDDEISIELAGTEYLRIDTVNNGGNQPTPRLRFLNSGGNIVLGDNSGSNISNTTSNGVRNIIIGENSGNGSTDYSNILIGQNVGSSGVSAQNVAIGVSAAEFGINRSVAIGEYAGRAGGLDHSVAIGINSAPLVTDAAQSVIIGSSSGFSLTSGDNNVMVGFESGFSLLSGSENTFLGRRSGYNTLGSNNVFLGDSAGFSEVGSNKLYIENSPTSTPLIYGNFEDDSVRVNGQLTATNGIDISKLVNPSATDGVFLDIQNQNGINNVLSGIRFKNNAIYGDTRYNAAIYHRFRNSNDYQLNFAVRTNPIPASNIDTSEIKMTINDNGRVGIGTTQPTSSLEVDGDIEIDSNGSTGDDSFYFGDPNANGTWRIKRDGNDLAFERRESGVWVFKMRINP